jgi:WD40 repeat protein
MTDVVLQLEELDFTKRSGPKQALAPRQRLMPWKRSITAPSNSPPVNSELPDGTLCLEKVHGYNANVSNSLYCISTGNEILYSIGKVLVRFSIEESSQRFYIANDKIVCLAFHQSTSICAVASQSRVVEIVDLNTMKSIRRNELEAVCMDFDSTGRHLALLSNEMIFILDWKNQVLVCSSETFNSVGTCIKFFDDLSIAECSLNNIRLWTYSSRSGSMAFEDVVMHDEMNNDVSCCKCQMIQNNN